MLVVWEAGKHKDKEYWDRCWAAYLIQETSNKVKSYFDDLLEFHNNKSYARRLRGTPMLLWFHLILKCYKTLLSIEEIPTAESDLF